MNFKTKKIVNVIPNETGGGAEAIVKKLLENNPHTNLDIEVIYFELKEPISFDKKIKATNLNLNPKNPLIVFKLRKIFKNLIKRHSCITIHAHLTWALYFVAIATIGLKTKLIYTEHSTNNKRRNYNFLQSIENYIYGCYDQIICISDGVSDSLKNWLAIKNHYKIKIILNGASLYLFKEKKISPKQKKFNLISVGLLHPRKGLDISIRAITQIKNQINQYIIVGEGAEKLNLERLVQELNLDKIVHLVGWSDKVENYYYQSDIQLIPSKWEGFGLVAIEGMSTGLAVIGSDVSGLRDILDPKLNSTKLVKEIDNPKIWEKKIIEMIDELKINSLAMSRASRKQAEKFPLEKMLNQYYQIYLEL